MGIGGVGLRVAPTLVLLALLLAFPAQAKDRVFAFVAKSVDDLNMVAAWRGCAREAEKQGDRCELLGGRGSADARTQAEVIRQALRSRRYAAMVVSVAGTEPVAAALKGAEIPIITCDSPLDPKYASLSRTYVGTDNVELGRDLARLARKQRPQGGTVCLMSDARDPNLIQRVEGVRRELSGDPHWPEGLRLNGRNGWIESPRSPWFTADSQKRTLDELKVTFQRLRPDVFISVGHWPVVQPEAYRALVQPYAMDLKGRGRIVVVAIGAYTESLDALLREGLVHGFVSIDFDQIGRISYHKMAEALEGRTLSPTIYVRNSLHAAR